MFYGEELAQNSSLKTSVVNVSVLQTNLFLQVVRLLFVCCLTLFLCSTLSRLLLQVLDLPTKCANTRVKVCVFFTPSLKPLVSFLPSFLTSAGTL